LDDARGRLPPVNVRFFGFLLDACLGGLHARVASAVCKNFGVLSANEKAPTMTAPLRDAKAGIDDLRDEADNYRRIFVDVSAASSTRCPDAQYHGFKKASQG